MKCKSPMRTWALGALLVFGAPSLALAECQRPTAPAAVDGATATLEQLKTAKQDVSAFMTASDDYQACVLKEVLDQKAAAKAAKTKLDPAIAKAADARVSENQADKERVGVEFNTAAKAYKAAHPS
ncbi:hypothetical protein LJR225_002602 [Phenylobacterium sp. LjRoot225]|uniref:hypothetical protein n=1 Tax=Phenylobacterium sp. LjRoot225 TaxID=3342285 RepID=UPI003ECD8F3D